MPSLEKLMDYDALYPPEWENDGTLLKHEVKRLTFDFYVALNVSTIPRRLGIYATPEEMAGDKQLGKKMANVALRALQWHSADQDWMHELGAAERTRDNDESYKEAAQRLWVPWYYDRITWIDQHIPVIACWAVKTGRRITGNQFCSRLINERKLAEEVWHKAAPAAWREPDDTEPDLLRQKD